MRNRLFYISIFVMLTIIMSGCTEKTETIYVTEEPNKNVTVSEDGAIIGELAIKLPKIPADITNVYRVKATINSDPLVTFMDGTTTKTIYFNKDNWEDSQKIFLKGAGSNGLFSCTGTPFTVTYEISDNNGVVTDMVIPTSNGVNLNTDEPQFFLAPYEDVNPLAAELRFNSTDNVAIGYEIMDKDNPEIVDVRKDPKDFNTDYIGNNSFPIIGLYEDHNNTIKVTIVNEEGNKCFEKPYKAKTRKVTELPDDKRPNIKVKNMEKMEPGWNMVTLHLRSSISGFRFFSFDVNGNIRWAFLNTGVSIRWINENTFIAQSPTNSELKSYSITGKELDTYTITEFINHHDFIILPNNKLLIAVTKIGASTIEDFLIEYDMESKTIIKEYDLKEFLKIERVVYPVMGSPVPAPKKEDWMHVNSVEYDASDNTIIFSGRTQGVFKIKRGTGVPKWIMSPHKEWHDTIPTKPTTPYLLKPLDKEGLPIVDNEVLLGTKPHDDFGWNFAQHHAQKLDTGEILMFDNGDNRFFEGEGTRENSYSRIVKYLIDEDNMTIQQTWEYGRDRGRETGENTVYSQIMSSAQFLEKTGNMLMGSAIVQSTATATRYSLMIEVDPTNNNEVVYEMSIENSTSIYRQLRTTYFDYYNGFGSEASN